MTIVSSAFVLSGPVQTDGRQYVVETHTDNIGLKHIVEYLAAVGANYQAIANARAPQIEEDLERTEAIAALAVDAKPNFNYQTGVQFIARLRAFYRDADKLECGRIATWLINRLNAGDVTAAQLQNAFGLTAAQWTVLQTKMTNLRLNYLAVIAAVGE